VSDLHEAYEMSLTMETPEFYRTWLTNFYKEQTTFNVRWKKTWWKEWISPAVFEDELLTEFSRKEIAHLVEIDLLRVHYYRKSNSPFQPRIKAYVFVDCVFAQRDPWKKRLVWMHDHPDVVARYAVLLGASLMLASFLCLKALAFGPHHPAQIVSPNFSGLDSASFFDDPGRGVRCYYATHDGGIGISCLKL
jgi:hypothetical protein